MPRSQVRPIKQEEYYQIFAFLNSDHEAQPRVYTPGEEMQRANVLRDISAIETRLREETPDWEAKLAAWEEEWRAAAKPEWTVIRPEVDKNATGGQRILRSRTVPSSPPVSSRPKAPRCCG